jgi:hypothetical protein
MKTKKHPSRRCHGVRLAIGNAGRFRPDPSHGPIGISGQNVIISPIPARNTFSGSCNENKL